MKKIVFLTGTRADFGKIKGLIQKLEEHPKYEPFLFVTGMHLLETYGYTLLEVQRCGFKNIATFSNYTHETTMDLTLAKTMEGFSAYVKDVQPDLIVVHGDRVEALAGALVGSLNNILVAHIEGGEVSGTIDELIRHSTSKMSHIHFVSNNEAEARLLQMGELPESIFVIGSPDVDIMFSEDLPSLQLVKKHYEIEFDAYAVVMFHPVTTEIDFIESYVNQFVDALLLSNRHYVVIYPNNDLGSRVIIEAYQRLKAHEKFRIFPSIRFEYFLTLLKNATFIIGNSSAGIREAPYYGIPTINVGTRQQNRSLSEHIVNVPYQSGEIVNAIQTTFKGTPKNVSAFGKGDSSTLFMEYMEDGELWRISHQKLFKDR
ncbi:MAG: UDP-N-acetylglucosamine 2-epimerase [Altibacter sp.]|uniref:UDP-N-acetylglucosamine 2-epimerase n=1 Tax=Altibacter sp. TaxID=2024823 RepID=UPI001D89450E|nr:UDP-N-acetylglucosamine 2-epimerase [Altibacter sp.]MBZ0326385.1 UDP-N-acetylglucosamine 2-epimerase [Altibacter sp.]